MAGLIRYSWRCPSGNSGAFEERGSKAGCVGCRMQYLGPGCSFEEKPRASYRSHQEAPRLAELPLKLHCAAGDPIPVPRSGAAYCEAQEIAQHLLSQAAAISEGSITLSPLELGEVWKVLSVLSV